MAQQLSAWPNWLQGHVVRNIYSGAIDLGGATPVAVWAAVLVVAAVVACRRTKDAFRLDLLVALTIISAVVSVSRIVGEIFPYLVTWTWAVGMLTWLAIAWSCVRWWQTRESPDARVGRIALGVVAAGLVVVSVVNVVDAAGAGNPDPAASSALARLVAKVRAALPPGDGVVEIRAGTTPGSVWIGAGVADALEHDGVDTRVTRDLAFAYGPDRVLDGQRVRLVVLPVEDPDVTATRKLPCYDESGRVGKYTLFLGDPECLRGE